MNRCGVSTTVLLAAVVACAVTGTRLRWQLPNSNAAAKQETASDVDRQAIDLLQRKCIHCHGPNRQEADLRLDRSYGEGTQGSLGVRDVTHSQNPRLLAVIAGKEGVTMPPNGPPLSDSEQALLSIWVAQGARWPAAQAVELDGRWAFGPLRRPDVPRVGNSAWCRNPIDNFIVARLEAVGREHSPEASRETLIRRLSLDLIGLPPSPDEVDRFVNDLQPDAYERLVERLLASPRYGERWARPWLDLARYADSDGYEKDRRRPHVWRYRHWLIEALNHNVPFDRFTVMQLAGDLLPYPTLDDLVATGFQRNAPANREGGTDPNHSRYQQMVDRVNTIGTAWLGITLHCAQCHDHKFDPIPQHEYFQIVALINDTEDIEIDAPLMDDGASSETSRQYTEQRREIIEASGFGAVQRTWEDKLRHTLQQPGESFVWDAQLLRLRIYVDNAERILLADPQERTPPEAEALFNFFLDEATELFPQSTWEKLDREALRARLAEAQAMQGEMPRAMVLREAATPTADFFYRRGDFYAPAETVEPGGLSILPVLERDSNEPGRMRLARWLVSVGNPLTPRVVANRQWQELMGVGLVSTPNDFGLEGSRPSHPELLNYLAVELRDSGWDIKSLHRLIVCSATYRQASTITSQAYESDATNSLWSRSNRVRLTAEQLRDSALFVAGLLDQRIGGPSCFPPLPAGVMELAHTPDLDWPEDAGANRYRRGLYIHMQRTVPYPFLSQFDAPSGSQSCARRTTATTPLQSLNLLNDRSFVEAAEHLALRICEHGGSVDERLQFAWKICLSRQATPEELKRCRSFFNQQLERNANAPGFASGQASGVETSDNQYAAWVSVARLLLNLDEFQRRE
jgi:hypothetical protein